MIKANTRSRPGELNSDRRRHQRIEKERER